MIDQPSQDSFLHWLYTNAPAAWLAFLVALGALILNLKLRKRPKRLVVREARRFSFLFIHSMIRDQIVTTFGGKPVSDLGFVQYELSNEGSEPIMNPSITLIMPDKTNIHRVYLSTDDDPKFDSETKVSVEKNRVTITLPYLNSFREHQQVHRVDIIADGETVPVKVSGSGESWSVRYLSRTTRQYVRGRFLSVFILGNFIGFTVMLLYVYMLHALGLGPHTPIKLLILATVPLLAIGGLCLSYVWYALGRFRIFWLPAKD